MSSPIYWSEMWNTLRADPRIRRHYQFWFYFYDSGKSLAFSAADLRDKLKEDIQKCSKEGPVKDVVVVGHSQGGLLAKMLVTDTGEKLFTAASGKTFETSGLEPEDLAFVKKYSVYEHIPQIHRVIFISTPHRGSFLASSLARRVARMFITFPEKAMNLQQTIDRIEDYMNTPSPLRGEMPTSLDSMAPDNPILNALADMPVAPGVHAHSIIPIDGDETPPEGDDGVVEYKSAHVDYVESEFILRCDHSAQVNPLAIEEVRRILIEHLKSRNLLINEKGQ
jgi:pimeloyl-ACP methyl ester carboxylesterase